MSRYLQKFPLYLIQLQKITYLRNPSVDHIITLEDILFVIELLTFGTAYLTKLSAHRHDKHWLQQKIKYIIGNINFEEQGLSLIHI